VGQPAAWPRPELNGWRRENTGVCESPSTTQLQCCGSHRLRANYRIRELCWTDDVILYLSTNNCAPPHCYRNTFFAFSPVRENMPNFMNPPDVSALTTLLSARKALKSRQERSAPTDGRNRRRGQRRGLAFNDVWKRTKGMASEASWPARLGRVVGKEGRLQQLAESGGRRGLGGIGRVGNTSDRGPRPSETNTARPE